MLRKLLVVGIVFAIGYVVGAVSAFRAAVTDYVENDGEKLEQVAGDIYPSPSEQTDETVPVEVRDALEGDSCDDNCNCGKASDPTGYQ